ncbi:MAG TPA: hypothetical protein PKD60_16530, partial [Turneriella sp.]|nr:hypothetical protein [Turneriella sp.]
MKPIKLRLLLWLLASLLLVEGLGAVWTSPAARTEADKDNPFVSGTLRLQLRYKDWLPSLETNYRYETATQGNMRTDGAQNQTAAGLSSFQQQPWHAMLGSYYNILNSLMVGGFYRYAQGERHRNDWVGSGWAGSG